MFDPEGSYLGRVSSPVELELSPTPVITADAIYGVVEDDLGVEYVVRLEIERPS